MIIVCPLSDLADAIREEAPFGVVTLLGPDMMIPELGHFEEGRHLRLEMNDIAERASGQILPGQSHLEDLLVYAKAWDQSAPLIIHCWAGISRSTAAALIIQAHLHPGVNEQVLAQSLSEIAPHARPNRKLIALADATLGRDGRLIAAAELVYRNEPVFEGVRFHYPLYGKK